MMGGVEYVVIGMPNLYTLTSGGGGGGGGSLDAARDRNQRHRRA